MDASKATEQSQDSKRQYTSLDHRYGKVAIPAVAAALCCQAENRAQGENRAIPYERD